MNRARTEQRCHKTWFCLLAVLGLLGCQEQGENLPQRISQVAPLKAPSDPLAAADLERFLQVIESHPDRKVPEFTAPDDDQGIHEADAAAVLVAQSREQFHRFLDPQRQGDLWARDSQWAAILQRQQMPPAEFAALVAAVSCAVTRARLDGRADLGELSEFARAEVNQLSERMGRIDHIPRHGLTKDQVAARTQAVLRLSRAVALLEFSETLARVPSENVALVRQCATRLRPLLPPTRCDPFAELQEWKRRRHKSQIVPASHVQRDSTPKR